VGAGVAFACRTGAPPPLDPAAVSCVPAGTVGLAGVDLDRLRTSPLYRQLPPAVAALLQTVRDAGYVLVAFNGRNFLVIARGAFRDTPAGATLIAPDLAVAGAPDLVREATAQRRTGSTGAPELVAEATPLARGNQVWIVARGDATLPLEGNAANLNRLLHEARYGTIAARVGDGIAVDATAVCGTPEAAGRLEESMRGLLTLAAAANARQPALAALLASVTVRRAGRTVRATLSADPPAAAELLRLF